MNDLLGQQQNGRGWKYRTIIDNELYGCPMSWYTHCHEGKRHIMVMGVLLAVGIYLAAGFLFALLFVLRGVSKIDPLAEHGTWGFRVAILPASVVFWPWLLVRWARGQPPPEECSPHRRAARTGGGCACQKKGRPS